MKEIFKKALLLLAVSAKNHQWNDVIQRRLRSPEPASKAYDDKLSAEQYAMLHARSKVLIECVWPGGQGGGESIIIEKAADTGHYNEVEVTVRATDGSWRHDDVPVYDRGDECKDDEAYVEICIYGDTIHCADIFGAQEGHDYKVSDCHFVFSFEKSAASPNAGNAALSGAQHHGQTTINIPTVIVANQATQVHHTATSGTSGVQPVQAQANKIKAKKEEFKEFKEEAEEFKAETEEAKEETEEAEEANEAKAESEEAEEAKEETEEAKEETEEAKEEIEEAKEETEEAKEEAEKANEEAEEANKAEAEPEEAEAGEAPALL